MTEAFDLLWEQGDGSGLEDLEAALAGCSFRLLDLLEFYVVQHLDDFADCRK